MHGTAMKIYVLSYGIAQWAAARQNQSSTFSSVCIAKKIILFQSLTFKVLHVCFTVP
jgi:hypothetical protein